MLHYFSVTESDTRHSFILSIKYSLHVLKLIPHVMDGCRLENKVLTVEEKIESLSHKNVARIEHLLISFLLLFYQGFFYHNTVDGLL